MRSLALVVVFAVAGCAPAATSPSPTPTPTSSATPAVTSATPTPTATATPPSARTQTLNSRAYVSGGQLVLPAFAIRFPSRYLATSADMIVPIASQGGISPPLVILSTRGQPLANDREYQEVLRASDDCVMVWATGGFGAIADWHRSVWESHAGSSYRTVAAETRSRIGSYDVVLQDVAVGTRTIATAFVPIGGVVSFYLHTCGEGNRADLRGVLESFTVSPRG